MAARQDTGSQYITIDTVKKLQIGNNYYRNRIRDERSEEEESQNDRQRNERQRPNREERKENCTDDDPPRNVAEIEGLIDSILQNDDEVADPRPDQPQINDEANRAIVPRHEMAAEPVIRDDRVRMEGIIGRWPFTITFPTTRSFLISIPVVIGVLFFAKRWFRS